MSNTQTFIGTLAVFNCWKCGIAFGITKSLETNRREDHEVFYCPNGHGNYFNGKSEAEKLKEQLSKKDETIQWYNERNQSLHNQLTEEKHRSRSLKGAKTRLKNRVYNGVCPCCNRTFANLLNHMKNQHPDYKES